MRMPVRKTKATRLHAEQGVHLQLQLEADPDCADLATRWASRQSLLLAAIEKQAAAHLAARRALATRRAADVAVDREVRLLRGQIDALAGGDHGAPKLQAYFPGGGYRVTAAPSGEEVRLVETILAKLASETEPTLLARREPLHAAFTSFRDAVAACEAAATAQRTAMDLLDAARGEWFRDYEQLHHELCARFVDDPARVKAYFLNDRRSH